MDLLYAVCLSVLHLVRIHVLPQFGDFILSPTVDTGGDGVGRRVGRNSRLELIVAAHGQDCRLLWPGQLIQTCRIEQTDIAHREIEFERGKKEREGRCWKEVKPSAGLAPHLTRERGNLTHFLSCPHLILPSMPSKT